MSDKNSEFRDQVVRYLVPVAAGACFLLGAGSARAGEDLSIGGGVTVIGQGISDVNYATNGAAETDVAGNPVYPDADGLGVTYSIDLTFERELESGTAFAYIIGAQGEPVYAGGNGDAEGPYFGGVDGDTMLGVAEAWYAHNFFDEMFTLKLGKIDPTANYDGNEVANDQTTEFLADPFINNRAILFPEYPYAPGMNFAFAFGEVVSLSFGIFEDSGANIAGEFENWFLISELGLHYELFDNPGNLRMEVWNSGYGDGVESRSGVAFNMDQGFGDELMAIFMRLGFMFGGPETQADLSGYPLGTELAPETSTAFSLGTRFNFGDGHSFGVAYMLDAPQLDTADAIHWLEGYIDFAVTEDVNFALDLQAIINSDYDANAEVVALYGFRTQVNF